MHKTRTLTLASVLLAIVGLAAPIAIGQATQSKQQNSLAPAQEMSAKTVTVDGKVSAVSDTSVTIVDAKKVEKTIAIDANTKVIKAGKAATPADIKANDSVIVVATKGEGDALTAVSIKVG
jgi:hypothetical protein